MTLRVGDGVGFGRRTAEVLEGGGGVPPPPNPRRPWPPAILGDFKLTLVSETY